MLLIILRNKSGKDLDKKAKEPGKTSRCNTGNRQLERVRDIRKIIHRFEDDNQRQEKGNYFRGVTRAISTGPADEITYGIRVGNVNERMKLTHKTKQSGFTFLAPKGIEHLWGFEVTCGGTIMGTDRISLPEEITAEVRGSETSFRAQDFWVYDRNRSSINGIQLHTMDARKHWGNLKVPPRLAGEVEELVGTVFEQIRQTLDETEEEIRGICERISLLKNRIQQCKNIGRKLDV